MRFAPSLNSRSRGDDLGTHMPMADTLPLAPPGERGGRRRTFGKALLQILDGGAARGVSCAEITACGQMLGRMLEIISAKSRAHPGVLVAWP